MLLDKFQMIANCYGGSNVLHMLILHSKCSINIPTSCIQPGTCRNIWNVPNLLSAGKWQVLSTRACNVLKMFLLVSRPCCPQCNLRTFLPWLRSLLGSLWIYFGSSLDLSDSSSILEIGPSSEILRISRPFTHLGPLPLPLPLTLRLPLPGHRWDFF